MAAQSRYERAAAVSLWLKEIAPDPELRRWFGHDPVRWMKFSRRHHAELAHNKLTVSPENIR
jgi:uncharacterized protein YeaO (DUF488 family)